VEFVVESELKQAIADVRSGADDWVFMTYEGDSTIKLLGKGKSSEPFSDLLNDTLVGYGLVRKIERIDVTDTIKFAYIRFIGDNIPRMLKARLGTHSGVVNAFFSPYHVSIEANALSEITDDVIMKTIRNASGTTVRVLADDAVQRKPPVTSSGTRPTSTNTTKQPAVPKVLGQTQTLKFPDLDGLKADIKEVRNDTSSTDWCLFGYEGGKGNTIVSLGKGSGGLEELLQNTKNDIVCYGLLRKTLQIDESLTVKFAFIQWIGENIDRMHKARLGTHKGAINELFAPYHVDLLCNNVSEVNDDLIMQKIKDASGTANKVKN